MEEYNITKMHIPGKIFLKCYNFDFIEKTQFQFPIWEEIICVIFIKLPEIIQNSINYILKLIENLDSRV